ncbi:MAG TPA: PDGLE domain-containing protein [Pseudonocardiaceae bacterium]
MRRFLIGFGLAALVIAGALSYLADPDPDGLDSVTRRGCVADEATGELSGECIARDATNHALGDGPLADYTVNGDDGLTGLAGVAGVTATFGVAGGLFWLLRRRSPAGSGDGGGTGS